MEKLELKHLAPYLPYGLKVEYEGIICDLEGFDFEFAIVERVSVDMDRIKPILRPISDIIKEIEFDGEKFVPIERIEYDYMQINGYYSKIKYLGYDKYAEWFSIEDYMVAILGLPYWILEKLFEYHFDVFNLCSKGLAIDINTLKQ